MLTTTGHQCPSHDLALPPIIRAMTLLRIKRAIQSAILDAVTSAVIRGAIAEGSAIIVEMAACSGMYERTACPRPSKIGMLKGVELISGGGYDVPDRNKQV